MPACVGGTATISLVSVSFIVVTYKPVKARSSDRLASFVSSLVVGGSTAYGFDAILVFSLATMPSPRSIFPSTYSYGYGVISIVVLTIEIVVFLVGIGLITISVEALIVLRISKDVNELNVLVEKSYVTFRDKDAPAGVDPAN